MKKVIALATVLAIGVSGLAFAQTMDNTTTGSTTLPGTPSGGVTAPSAGNTSQTTNTQATIVPQPGSATTVPTMSGQAAGNQPLKGANSFTEKEAERRLSKRGYTNIAGLAKDNSGVWRGTATNKSSQSVSIALDYKGRITETK